MCQYKSLQLGRSTNSVCKSSLNKVSTINSSSKFITKNKSKFSVRIDSQILTKNKPMFLFKSKKSKSFKINKHFFMEPYSVYI